MGAEIEGGELNTRRIFLILLIASCATAVFAQSPAIKLARAGILAESTKTKSLAVEKVFIDALRELGWIEDRNVIFDRVYADDNLKRPPALSEELLARHPDVIFAPSADPLHAALAKTRTIPVVFGAAQRTEFLSIAGELRSLRKSRPSACRRKS